MAQPIDFVKEFVDLATRTDLHELAYENENVKLKIVRGAPAPPPPTAFARDAESRPVAAPAAADTAINGTVVKSPMIGVIYTSADPDSPPYVNVGDTVAKDQTLFLVEAMKTFNPIKAPVAGRIARIMIATATAVEYDQPLAVIE